MTKVNETSGLTPGISIIHANRLEELRDVAAHWLTAHPLPPLEPETVLVQSNGMGQWLKQCLAQNSVLGIAAGIETVLPGVFIWNAYRAVLGETIPPEQPLAKAPLTWRLYRLLPVLRSDSTFAALAAFLQGGNVERKQYQLAEKLADLFDQYQVYRADWLADWEQGRNVLQNPSGKPETLPFEDQWQADLWRKVLSETDLSGFIDGASRAGVHARFMAAVDRIKERPSGIPPRVIVFGLSSLPRQTLEAIAKLGKFCQILLFVQNPCRYFWTDIVEDKTLLQAQRHNQAEKSGLMESVSGVDELSANTSTLLAAWGKQGRDYLRLLDQFDESRHYRNWTWPDGKIDLFIDYTTSSPPTLLQRLQQQVLDLEPSPATPQVIDQADDSLIFQVAHSPQREIEILHDYLLARYQTAAENGAALQPRDVVVMVPDIDAYAPAIRAVFGLYPKGDPRHIPYSLADQKLRGRNSILISLEALLKLPETRFCVSEIFDLLEVGSIRARFGIDTDSVDTIRLWSEGAGVRWGLNGQQRAAIGAMSAGWEANSWQFGLRRMLLGYAVGDGADFNNIQPYPEIGGLEAQWLGNLTDLLDTLESFAKRLQERQSARRWRDTLNDLIDDFFLAGNDDEKQTLDALRAALDAWLRHCEIGGLGESDLLPIEVVREAWLAELDAPSLHRRFLSGRVNFCTLMPMRAIPFRQICLLGMNDGDFPRSQPHLPFDLINRRGQYRPGDRSRRQDDQYLFLEALLSAREQLYVSWVGRSIRDNSERPPSVLVGRLRDAVKQRFCLANGKDLLAAITVLHPLQPFSATYVKPDRDPRLFTYAREWFGNITSTTESTVAAINADAIDAVELPLAALARFLRAPVRTYCRYTLKLDFQDETTVAEDDEPFQLDSLETYHQTSLLLDALLAEAPANPETFLAEQQNDLNRRGELPLGGFADNAYRNLADPVRAAWDGYRHLLSAWPGEPESRIPNLPCFNTADGETVQLSGVLRLISKPQTKPGDESAKAALHVRAQGLLTNTGIHYSRLLDYWVEHLAGCAGGIPLQTFVAAPDTIISLSPIEKTLAGEQLATLVQAFRLGLKAPLPIACKTALAWLIAKPEAALEKARRTYEGYDWTLGERAYDPYLARFFPAFSDLVDDPSEKTFEHWAQILYRPLVECAAIYRIPTAETQP